MTNMETNRVEYKRELDKGDKLEKAVVSLLKRWMAGTSYASLCRVARRSRTIYARGA